MYASPYNQVYDDGNYSEEESMQYAFQVQVEPSVNGFYPPDASHPGYPPHEYNVTPSYAQYSDLPNNRNIPTSQYSLPNTSKMESLVAVNALPARFQKVFPFTHFNCVQSQCYDKIIHSHDNVVVSAPTSSGKTGVLELSLVALHSLGHNNKPKAVYVAPTKALCSERLLDWKEKFGRIQLTCAEWTGDTDAQDAGILKKADIIITTPEKWDSYTRRWADHKPVLQLVQLFMIDEVHMLNESRGATLEVIVSRMRTLDSRLSKSSGCDTRFIATSATIPNTNDICQWLSYQSRPAVACVFDDSYRPVQLEKHVLAFSQTEHHNAFQFENMLNYRLSGVIQQHSHGKPTLIFSATRRGAISAAEQLTLHRQPWTGMDPRFRSELSKLKDKKLQDMMSKGVAYHHGGMDQKDRHCVESLFAEGLLQVVSATSTLAVGVNLPAHLVIIKSTCQYVNHRYCEYSEFDILQMMGRAGRPQFDTSGVAVIMTSQEQQHKYEALCSGTQIIESSLHKNLIEHVNAEVVLKTICDVPSAVQWMKSTFFYVRAKAHPGHYGIDTLNPSSADVMIEEILMKQLNLLEQHGMLQRAGPDKKTLQSTPVGDCMAKYFLQYETMLQISKTLPEADIKDHLMTMSKSSEFENQIRFNPGDKGYLNQINTNKLPISLIKYPLRGKVKELCDKIYLLLQLQLVSDVQELLPENKLKSVLLQEAKYLLGHCQRVAKCLIEYCVHSGYAVALQHAIEVCAILNAGIWSDGCVIRQVRGIGRVMGKNLMDQGIRTMNQLRQCESWQLEAAANRHAPFGQQLQNEINQFPMYELDLKVSPLQQDNNNRLISIQVQVQLLHKETLKATNDQSRYSFAHLLILIRNGIQGSQLVSHQRLSYYSHFQNHPIHTLSHARLKQLENGFSLALRVPVALNASQVEAFILNDEAVGLNQQRFVPIQRMSALVQLDQDDLEDDLLLSLEDPEMESKSVATPIDVIPAMRLTAFTSATNNSMNKSPNMNTPTTTLKSNTKVSPSTPNSYYNNSNRDKPSIPLSNQCRHQCVDREKYTNARMQYFIRFRCKHNCCKWGVKRRRLQTIPNANFMIEQERQQPQVPMLTPPASDSRNKRMVMNQYLKQFEYGNSGFKNNNSKNDNHQDSDSSQDDLSHSSSIAFPSLLNKNLLETEKMTNETMQEATEANYIPSVVTWTPDSVKHSNNLVSLSSESVSSRLNENIKVSPPASTKIVAHIVTDSDSDASLDEDQLFHLAADFLL